MVEEISNEIIMQDISLQKKRGVDNILSNYNTYKGGLSDEFQPPCNPQAPCTDTGRSVNPRVNLRTS